MARRIIAACIDREIEFDSPEEVKAYIDGLIKAKKNFRIIHDTECDGRRRVRIKEQYNKNQLMGD